MEVTNALGRRKTSVARVYLTPGSGVITVNKKDFKDYFPAVQLQYAVTLPFEAANIAGQWDVLANVDGGGITGQADAVKLAISRALVKTNAELKPMLKLKGLLTRDPRMVERKKPGQKKARKRFQFSKR
jgi:small subunit ribosomal protein S9